MLHRNLVVTVDLLMVMTCGSDPHTYLVDRRGPPRIKRVILCAHRPLKSCNVINHCICLAVNRLLGKLTLIKGFSRAKGEMGELLPFDDECVYLFSVSTMKVGCCSRAIV